MTIEACEAALRAAILTGDIAGLDDLLAADLIFTDQNGRCWSKADDLAAHRSGILKISRLDFSDRQIRPLGDNAAVVVVVADIAGRHDGRDFAGTLRYTRVWRGDGGVWRIAAAHCSAVV
ncbi:nuclear transport factor 2 family protein [Telmatospirillum sp.]|uniref:nuclear transport factor 2 family protein n=1 Tax=Telmatospirillum sp. TaxID=2079197 RepID=UPI00284461DA|nr:nuclear transport factor 2 family protein [Telmatospirillum sp.]MDR3438708.1 nuclear transport factor 2 family protein [Telmatospirillum sp.]